MKPYDIKINDYRKSDYPINQLFLNRWSPRAMSGEPMTKDELMLLFEAARWAPSSYNTQPWKFIYALKNSKNWDVFFNLLSDFNKAWCKNASALIICFSDSLTEVNGELKPSPTHAFDTGSSWQNLALQANLLGLIAHGMSGFDYEKARKAFRLPERYQINSMIAVGKQGDIDDLPEQIKNREQPSQRKSVNEFVFENDFIENNKEQKETNI